MEKYSDVEIVETPIYNKEHKEVGKITVLRGGFYHENPKSYMDEVVSYYVQNSMYNEFIEEFLDNPWVRVIIGGINELPYVKYNGQQLNY